MPSFRIRKSSELLKEALKLTPELPDSNFQEASYRIMSEIVDTFHIGSECELDRLIALLDNDDVIEFLSIMSAGEICKYDIAFMVLETIKDFILEDEQDEEEE